MSSSDSFTWIFGYGSIMWRPAFRFVERQRATVRGWQRRLWQGSPDHRGTPERPGRVVTLVEEAAATCHGLAFEIETHERAAILAYLDERESGGYVRVFPLTELHDGRVVSALTYFAPPENLNFLGPAALPQVAAQIVAASGASGNNTEYVLELATALRAYEIDDAEIFALEPLLRGDPRGVRNS